MPWFATIIVVLTGIAGILLLVGPIATYIAKEDGEKGETLNSTRDTLLKAAGGFLLVIGALGTIGTLQYTAQTTRMGQEQLAAVQKQVADARDEAVTTRYTSAVDQIASSKLAARAGGIYALERIMKDSTFDRPTIVEVLAAFLREAPPYDEDRQPAADIQAAVTVLSRRPTQPSTPGQRIDLHDSFLSNAEFDGGSFEQADLSGAQLGGAEFTNALLKGADFGSSDLSGSILINVEADRAIFDNGTDLTGADLTRANLRNADLRGARFDSETKLDGTNLTGADYEGPTCEGSTCARP